MTEAIDILCDECGEQLDVPSDDYVGTVQCPRCTHRQAVYPSAHWIMQQKAEVRRIAEWRESATETRTP